MSFLIRCRDWVNGLLQRTLPLDWCARLRAYLAPWEGEGFRLLPESVDELESWIFAWARFRHLLPPTVGNGRTHDSPMVFPNEPVMADATQFDIALPRVREPATLEQQL